MRANEFERLVAGAGARDDFDVRFDFEQRGKCAEDHGLILGDYDADHAERSIALTDCSPLASGSETVSVVPCDPSRATKPPSAAMRSRMPLMPAPSFPPPRPSSETVSRMSSPTR